MSYFENNVWGRSQYHNIDGKEQATSVSKSIIGSFIFGLLLVLILVSLWNIRHHHTIKTSIVILDTSLPQLHKISPRFLSFGLDSSLLRDMKNFPIQNEKFINLARHLSPAYVRVGGTSADCLYFNVTPPANGNSKPVDDQNIDNFMLRDVDYLAIYEFTNKAQLRMMFDLNVLIRGSDGTWNDSNAERIINYSMGHNMVMDWQLGNEPNSFRHVFNRSVSAKSLADDYRHLRRLLNELGYGASILVGPEANHIGDTDAKGDKYLEEFLENDMASVDYVTWHQYYLNGREATVKDFINPEVFNRLPTQINNVNQAIAASGRNINMWISETSTAYGGGAPELSDRFVAGFLWLDKLGYSASTGVNVVVRQSFYGGNYAMIGNDLQPNPDWWVSVLFKQLVSSIVLEMKSSTNFGTLRMYAHCTAESALITRVPAVTVYGMNLDKETANLVIQGSFSHRTAKVFLYILTADYLKSRNIRLNGEVLKLKANGNLPAFKPIITDSTKIIALPPLSMAFIVIHGVEVKACVS